MQTKTTHTPGPWTIEGGTIIDSRRNIVAIRHSWRHLDLDENSIRSANFAIHPVEADANNHLIAAAPEMYDLLTEAIPGFNPDQWEDWLDRLANLILKVKGAA